MGVYERLEEEKELLKLKEESKMLHLHQRRGNMPRQNKGEDIKMTKKPENPIPPKIRRERCIAEITDMIERVGPWSVNCLALAREYDFEWKTIKRWYNSMILSIHPEEIKNIKIMSENTLTKNLNYLERVRSDPRIKPAERIRATVACNDTIEKLTKFLQEIGRLDKVADKLNLEVGETTRDVLKGIFTQLKGEKKDVDKPDDKSSDASVVQVQSHKKSK